MTYLEAKEMKSKLQEKYDATSKELEKFNKYRISMGIVPDHIRETPEYQKAAKEYDLAFAEIRNFNGWFVKAFKKEYAADRRKRFAKSK